MHIKQIKLVKCWLLVIATVIIFYIFEQKSCYNPLITLISTSTKPIKEIKKI